MDRALEARIVLVMSGNSAHDGFPSSLMMYPSRHANVVAYVISMVYFAIA